MKISFIGLGIMGSRMAQNLLKNQVELTVFNRSKEPMEALVKQGAKAATSYADAVNGADIVFTMLSSPEVVGSLVFGEKGFLQDMSADALWVDCSTVNPSFSRGAAAHAQNQGIRFLDAPVAGTKPHAENAELVFFVGGSTKDVEQATPYMDMMGKKVMHVGEIGKGASFKMLVNAMLGRSMVIFSETILLGQKMGFDRDFLLNVVPNLVVAAPVTKFKAEMIRSEDYEVQFPLELMHKDMHLASVTAYEYGQPLYMANIVKELFASAKESGLGREDFGAIHKYLERK